MIIEENISIYTQIIEKAFEITTIPSTQPFIDDYSKMSLEEQIEEFQNPKVLAHNEANLTTIFLRFVVDGNPLVEGIYYPYIAVDSFWKEAQQFYKDSTLSEEDIEERVMNDCVYMTVTLINTIYGRLLIPINWFVEEIINNWYENVRKHQVQKGFFVPKSGITKLTKRTFQKQMEEAEIYWKIKGEALLNEQYMALAKEYPRVLEHWQFLGKASRNFGKKSDKLDSHAWKMYAKPTEFADTPDDLLEKLEFMNTKDVWKLAIEHSARRVGLFKIDGVKEDILEKRRQRIMKTGYDSNYLLGLLNKGKELIVKMKSENHLNANTN